MTLCDPLAPTVPIPWLMVRVSAPPELHVRMADEPAQISVKSAEILTVGRLFTVTVTFAVRVPKVLIAVIVYVVVTAGFTSCVPGVFSVTAPTPPSILTESALEDVHESVEDSPSVMVSGNAAILVCGKLFTEIVTLTVSDPCVLDTVRV